MWYAIGKKGGTDRAWERLFRDTLNGIKDTTQYFGMNQEKGAIQTLHDND